MRSNPRRSQRQGSDNDGASLNPRMTSIAFTDVHYLESAARAACVLADAWDAPLGRVCRTVMVSASTVPSASRHSSRRSIGWLGAWTHAGWMAPEFGDVGER